MCSCSFQDRRVETSNPGFAGWHQPEKLAKILLGLQKINSESIREFARAQVSAKVAFESLFQLQIYL